jgi:hypothetical protein
MKTKRRIEITVESHRILVMHRRRLLEGWCERCGKQVAMINLEEAALAGLSSQAITRQVEGGRFHFTASADGSTFICLKSLVEEI